LSVVLTAIGPISDIDGEISHYQRILSSLPRSDPLTFSLVGALAGLYNNRYVQSEQKIDLDRATFHFTQAIFVSRPSRDVDGQNIIRTFFLLASVLLQRTNHFGQPSDAQYCAEYFRYLQSQPLEAFDVPLNQVRADFVLALASQVKMGIGNPVRHIDEMTDYCRELLASNVPKSHILVAARALASADWIHRERSSELEVSDKVIKFLREANRRLDSHGLAYDFAGHLCRRFAVTNAIDDYEEAMAIFDKIISSESNGNYPGPYLEDAAYSSASLAWNRAHIYKNPKHIEPAVYRSRSFLRISSTDDFRRRKITELLNPTVTLRSMTSGVTEGLQEAQYGDTELEVTDVSSFSGLVSSLLAKSTPGKAHWWTERRREVHLRPLKSVCSTTDLAEIEAAIKYCRLLLASNPPSDDLIYQCAISLGEVLFHAFKRTDRSEYLDQSVDTFRDMLEMPIPSYTLFGVIRRLLEALLARVSFSGEQDDFEEVKRYTREPTGAIHAFMRMGI